MVFTKIVVAGSTGRVADHVIPLLLASTQPKYDVTLLTRAGSKPKIQEGAKVIAVDYNDHASLVQALKGADALLSLVAGPPSKAVDRLLLKAAEEAGVRRMFPSEHTLDVLHPGAVKILTEGGQWPEDLSPVDTGRMFLDLAEKGSPVSFTTVMCGAFQSGWLEGEFGMFDPRNHKATVLDGGDHYFTGCTYPYLAAAIVAILQMDEEKTKNKRIAVAEVRMTMNQVVDLYDEVTGIKFERTSVPSAAILKHRDDALAALAALAPATDAAKRVEAFTPALFTAITVAAFNGNGSADLKEGLNFNADGLLKSEKKSLKQMAVEALQKVGAV